MLNSIKIEISGRPRLFRFDMYAIELLYDGGQTDFPGRLGFVAKMLYAGLASGCNAEGIENDFTRADVLDMLDELSANAEGREKIENISGCLQNSQAYKSVLTAQTESVELNEEEKKSLLNGIASAPLPLVN